jgi:hypothetical protein
MKPCRLLLAVAYLSSSCTGFSSYVHPSTNGGQQRRSRPSLSESKEEDDRNDMIIISERRSFLTSTASSLLTIISSLTFSPTNAMATSPEIITPAYSKDLSWPLGKVAFSLLPLAATSTRRATVEECIIPDTIWTHDQIQGVVNVNVPVRQIVVKVRILFFSNEK